MYLWLLALILAFLPGVGLLWYIRRIDKYEPEPWSTMGLAFLAGCISVIPAFLIEALLHAKTGGFVGTLYEAFIVAALTEEVCKGGLGLAFMWRRSEFDEVMDGIVYFGLAHMGFAITENLGYIFLRSDGNVVQALMTGFMRTTTAVPLHVVSGMIMGYHIGAARFAKNFKTKAKNWFLAFSLPVLLHGIYDLAAFNENFKVTNTTDLLRAGFGTALFYAAVVALWLVLMPRVQAAQDASPFKPHERVPLPVAPVSCPNCGSDYPDGANYCHMCATPVAQSQVYAHQAPTSQ
ncbi:MAG TPA: PrsW family glutamic-type intramembrane protease [Symbiobacteriaceae bacterium]|jgi:RsiW-degrading membrane proteinase PrsW (M82 family)